MTFQLDIFWSVIITIFANNYLFRKVYFSVEFLCIIIFGILCWPIIITSLRFIYPWSLCYLYLVIVMLILSLILWPYTSDVGVCAFIFLCWLILLAFYAEVSCSDFEFYFNFYLEVLKFMSSIFKILDIPVWILMLGCVLMLMIIIAYYVIYIVFIVSYFEILNVIHSLIKYFVKDLFF